LTSLGGIGSLDSCPLCSIPLREKIIYQDDLIYLAETKELKGHKVRLMAVIKRHSAEPTFEERVLCTVKLYNNMRKSGGDFFIVNNDHCSVPDHWHLMACDADGHADPLLYSTPRVRFS
jgi:hypothetical protein